MSRFKGVFAVLVLLCLGFFAFGCGGDDGVTKEDIDDAIRSHDEKQKLQQLQKQVKRLQKQSGQSSGRRRAGTTR